jgi:hypothetical protein
VAAKSNRVSEASHVQQASQEPQTHQPANNHSLEEQIRHRAHELYLQRGGNHGSDLEDWLQAEDELLMSNGTTTPAKPRSKSASL